MFSFFKNTTVDAVLSNFNKTIQDLKTIEETHTQMALDKQERIKVLTAETKNHQSEANRADAVAKKISELIGG